MGLPFRTLRIGNRGPLMKPELPAVARARPDRAAKRSLLAVLIGDRAHVCDLRDIGVDQSDLELSEG